MKDRDIRHEVMPDGRHSTIVDGQRFVDINKPPDRKRFLKPIDHTRPRMIGEARPRRKTVDEIMDNFFKGGR